MTENKSNMNVNQQEYFVLKQALNEVCNGPEAIEEWEFYSRMGVEQHEALDILANLDKKPTSTQHVLIIHEVADYVAWKKVFDNAADIRKEAGERSYQVLKYEHEPNKIVHFSQWTSIEAAKQFFESPKLVQIRIEAGVKAPDFIYLEQLESGIL